LAGGAFVAIAAVSASAREAVGATSLYGWWSNPTPNNASLIDVRGEFIVSEQGGVTADGDWPDFSRARFVHTNGGSYGYGCASLRVAVVGRRVTRIYSSITLPLRRCRASVALRRAEPSIK